MTFSKNCFANIYISILKKKFFVNVEAKGMGEGRGATKSQVDLIVNLMNILSIVKAVQVAKQANLASWNPSPPKYCQEWEPGKVTGYKGIP